MKFHEFIGFIWLTGLIILLVFPYIRMQSALVDRAVNNLFSHFGYSISYRAKWWLMVFIGTASLGIFTYCELCEARSTEFFPNASNPAIYNPLIDYSVFHMFYKFAIRTFPFIIWGIIIAGFVMKYFVSGRFKFPRSIPSSFVLGATLPLCSCGVVPMVKAMFASKDIPVRTVVTFLVVTPILNPFVIFLSYTVMGWEYLAARVAAIFVLAVGIGILMEKLFTRDKFNDNQFNCTAAGCSPEKCSTCPPLSYPNINFGNPGFSALLYSYELGKYLLPYMIIGVLIGGFIEVFVPPPVIGEYLSSNIMGLLIATTVGIPIFICSGEEILILKPLMDMGLPLGHAIAFTIAGNGICITSIALLFGILRKTATVFLTAIFWLGTFILSLLINLIV